MYVNVIASLNEVRAWQSTEGVASPPQADVAISTLRWLRDFVPRHDPMGRIASVASLPRNDNLHFDLRSFDYAQDGVFDF